MLRSRAPKFVYLVAVMSILSLFLNSCLRNNDTELQTLVTLDNAIPAPALPLDMWTLDELFAEINRDVPGFAGFVLDKEDTLNVSLVNRAQLLPARDAISALFGNNFLNGAKQTYVNEVKYAFNQLALWKMRIVPHVTAPEITFVDIDEINNQIKLGVLNSDVSEKYRALFLSLAIPIDAVTFEVAPLPDIGLAVIMNQPLSPMAVNDSIRGTVDPRTGGIEIRPPAGGTCTLGFAANLTINNVNQRGFVTNSHCSAVKYNLDSSAVPAYKQPFSGGTIGKEIKDPRPFTTNCPYSGASCRYSDANFVDFYDTVRSSRKIAVGTPTPNDGPPNFDIRYFQNVTVQEPPMLYGQAEKTGRTTSATFGSIISGCFDTPSSDTPNVWLLCQYKATYKAWGGDSGSPVYSPSSGRLYGMNWTKDEDPDPPNFNVFSPLAGIKRDLGASLSFIEP